MGSTSDLNGSQINLEGRKNSISVNLKDKQRISIFDREEDSNINFIVDPNRNKAIDLYKTTQYEEAKTLLVNLSTKYPDDKEISIYLAKTLENLNDHVGAIDVFSRLIERHIGDYSLYSLRAYSYFSLKDFKSAISDLNKIIENKSENLAIYLSTRARCYLNLQKYNEAIEDFSKAISLSSPINKINSDYLYRGIAYLQIKGYDSAIYDLERYLKSDPQNTIALEYLSFAKKSKITNGLLKK